MWVHLIGEISYAVMKGMIYESRPGYRLSGVSLPSRKREKALRIAKGVSVYSPLTPFCLAIVPVFSRCPPPTTHRALGIEVTLRFLPSQFSVAPVKPGVYHTQVVSHLLLE